MGNKELRSDRLSCTVKDILGITSTGQMIRIVFLNNDGDENGNTLNFENDRIELVKPEVKKILNKNVIWISSTTDDYLRIEVQADAEETN